MGLLVLRLVDVDIVIRSYGMDKMWCLGRGVLETW